MLPFLSFVATVADNRSSSPTYEFNTLAPRILFRGITVISMPLSLKAIFATAAGAMCRLSAMVQLSVVSLRDGAGLVAVTQRVLELRAERLTHFD